MSNQQQQRRPGGQPFGPQGQQGPKKGPKFSLSWIYAIIAIALAFMWMKGGESTSGITRDITYSEFKQYIAKGYAEKVVAYDDNRVELTIIPDSAVHLFGQSTVQKGQPVVLPHAAALCDGELVPVEASVGRIASQFLVPYPPGIPVFIPGLRITKEMVRLIEGVIAAEGVSAVHGLFCRGGHAPYYVEVLNADEERRLGSGTP